MARFKDKDLHILQNEELLLGNAQDASIKYDGSDLVINKVPYHNTEGYLATQQFVSDALLGIDWQDSVLSRTTDIPGGPTEGDRYIIPSGASGAWSGLDDTIAEYTTTWVYKTPSAGFTLWVEDEGVYYTYNNAWVKMGTVVDHSNLLNLDVDDHTQYFNTTRHTDFSVHGTSSVDHGQIFGLGDDDHSIYLTTGRHDTTDRHGSSVVDHGSIGGLADDDHTQYLAVTGGRPLTADWDAGAYDISCTRIKAQSGSNMYLQRNAGDLGVLINTDGQTVIQSTCFLQGDAYLGDNKRLTFGAGYDNTIIYSTTTDTLQILDGNTVNSNVIAHFSSIGVSATAFYGDGTGITGQVWDHGDLTGLLDDDHTQYLHTDGRRPWDGTLTVASTGSQIQFTEDFAYIGVSSNTDLMTLSPTGVTVDGVIIGDIDHDTLTNTHNLTTDIDHDTITNTHNLNVDIDHGSIGGLAGDDHPQYFLLSSAATVSGDILAATAGLDIGSVGTPFSDIYCDTLHTSASSINLGSIVLSDVAGELAVDATPVISLTTTQEASANALSQANDYTDVQIIGSGMFKGYDTQSTSSGVSHDVTGISENAVQINVYWRNVSNNNSSYAPILQLHNQSTAQATGHDGWVNAGASNDRNDTDGMHVFNKTSDHVLGDIYDGMAIITRMSADGTIWSWMANSLADAETNNRTAVGYVVLTSAFGGSLRITSESGGATFDGGSFWISWF